MKTRVFLYSALPSTMDRDGWPASVRRVSSMYLVHHFVLLVISTVHEIKLTVSSLKSSLA